MKKKHTNEFRNTNREATPSKYRPQLWISTFIKFLDAIISRRYSNETNFFIGNAPSSSERDIVGDVPILYSLFLMA